MRKDSIVFSESRYRMPLAVCRNVKTNWISCMEEKKVTIPKKFTQLVDFLLSEADSNGVIFATISEIEERTAISYRTISMSLLLLERYKLIKKRNGIILINFAK